MKKRIKRPALSGTQIGIMLIGSLCLLLFGMLLAIQNYLEHQISEEQEQTVYFDRHYAMLLEENEDPFWTAVYDSAEQMGKEKNACVELIGEGMPSSFGLAGKLSVVIDSQVDGIIIRPDASDEVNELIEQAKEQGIPVVSVMDDYSGKSQAYVGVSSYDVGQAYGKLILDLQQDEDVRKVTILQSAEDSENTISSVESSLAEVLAETDIVLDTKTITGSDAFSIEEKIQEYVMSENAPDILICMNTVTAIGAYHVVVDCNIVGDVQLLVNYATGEILDAIEKGGIFASVSLDAQRLGSSCIQCLDDLVCDGKTNNYRSIPLKVITIDTVEDYRSTLEGAQ